MRGLICGEGITWGAILLFLTAIVSCAKILLVLTATGAERSFGD
jgi:hypothetical protein